MSIKVDIDGKILPLSDDAVITFTDNRNTLGTLEIKLPMLGKTKLANIIPVQDKYVITLSEGILNFVKFDAQFRSLRIVGSPNSGDGVSELASFIASNIKYL